MAGKEVNFGTFIYILYAYLWHTMEHGMEWNMESAVNNILSIS